MIGKQVPNSRKSSSKAQRVGLLTAYIVNPELENGQEKCIHYEAENFTTSDLDLQILEMIALSRQAVRSKDPIDHFVLSWQYGETPTVDQAREAVKMTMAHLGLAGHQTIWAMHADTDNIHIHIEVNRVNPETSKVVEINKGFQLNAIQQAAALVEKAQGWKLHDKARFRTDEFGHLIIDKSTGRPEIFEEPGKGKKISGKVKDRELQRGEQSAQRIGIENAPAIIASASSWADLHAKMQAAGMEYTRQGSGAAIKVGDTLVKASDIVDRKNNFGALQKRFGIYQPSNQLEFKNDPCGRINIITDERFTTGFDQPDAAQAGFGTYDSLRSLPRRDLAMRQTATAHKATGKGVLQFDAGASRGRADRMRRGGNRPGAADAERNTATTTAGNRGPKRAAGARPGRGRTGEAGRDGQRIGLTSGTQKQLSDTQPGWAQYQHIKAERDASKSAERLALQQRHDAERAALAAKQKAERGDIFSGDWKGKGDAKNLLKSLTATQQAAEKLEVQDRQRQERQALQAKYKPLPMYKQWREQPQIVGLVVLPLVDQDAEREKQITVAKTLRSLTHTVDARQHITYQLNSKNVFRDEGRTIQVLDLNSEAGIAAALATAQQKFGQVLTLTGSPEFQRNAVAVAVANGLTCKFADPQLEAMREQLQAEKYQAARDAARAERERTTKTLATVIPPIQQPGEAVPLAPSSPAEQLPAQTANQWLAEQPKRVVEAYATGDSKTEFVVVHVAADGIVIDHGTDLAKYPVPRGVNLQPGDRVVLGKKGAIAQADTPTKGGKDRGR